MRLSVFPVLHLLSNTLLFLKCRSVSRIVYVQRRLPTLHCPAPEINDRIRSLTGRGINNPVVVVRGCLDNVYTQQSRDIWKQLKAVEALMNPVKGRSTGNVHTEQSFLPVMGIEFITALFISCIYKCCNDNDERMKLWPLTCRGHSGSMQEVTRWVFGH